MNRHGQFQLGTMGDRPEEHLAVLTQPGGIENYEHFRGRRLPESEHGEPHNQHLDTDERQNLLAQWFEDIYISFHDNQLVRNGPADKSGLYDCPIEIRNFFPRPITVVQGRIYHQRFDERYEPQAFPAWETKVNETWSPAAKEPIKNVDLGFTVTMKCTPDVPSALLLFACTDNRNSSGFQAEGLSLDDGDLDLVEGTHSFLRLDKKNGVCKGSHTDQCQVLALLYGQAPTRIELKAVSDWSVVQPSFRYATLGEVEYPQVRIRARGSVCPKDRAASLGHPAPEKVVAGRRSA